MWARRLPASWTTCTLASRSTTPSPSLAAPFSIPPLPVIGSKGPLIFDGIMALAKVGFKFLHLSAIMLLLLIILVIRTIFRFLLSGLKCDPENHLKKCVACAVGHGINGSRVSNHFNTLENERNAISLERNSSSQSRIDFCFQPPLPHEQTENCLGRQEVRCRAVLHLVSGKEAQGTSKEKASILSVTPDFSSLPG